ncbi:hypothetical protein MTsN3n11_05690 [Qipengyuania sp. MTN3-11]
MLAIAAAEVPRAARFLMVPLGLAIAAVSFLFGGDSLHIAVSLVGDITIAVLAFPRGRVTQNYGSLDGVVR